MKNNLEEAKDLRVSVLDKNYGNNKKLAEEYAKKGEQAFTKYSNDPLLIEELRQARDSFQRAAKLGNTQAYFCLAQTYYDDDIPKVTLEDLYQAISYLEIGINAMGDFKYQQAKIKLILEEIMDRKECELDGWRQALQNFCEEKIKTYKNDEEAKKLLVYFSGMLSEEIEAAIQRAEMELINQLVQSQQKSGLQTKPQNTELEQEKKQDLDADSSKSSLNGPN